MDPYQQVRLLGRGGMGDVYLAVDERDGSEVALKILRKEFADDPEFRHRFAREVAAAQRVQGRSIARVVGGNLDAPQPWIASEYVPGPTLRDDRESADLRALAAGLARALVEIHEAGVVHRDLTPANVMLGPDGPRVVDFGIAWYPDATVITRTGTTVGTPAWMAPEQLGEDVSTAASDIWAWGAVMAFAATGRPPVTGSRPEVIHLRASRGQLDLDGLPDWLEPLVRRAMDPDPARRPTAVELAGELGVRTDHDLTEVLDRTWVTPPGAEPTEVSRPGRGQRVRAALVRWAPGVAAAVVGAVVAANASALPVIITVALLVLVGAYFRATDRKGWPAGASFGLAGLLTAGVGLAQVIGPVGGALAVVAIVVFLFAIGADVF